MGKRIFRAFLTVFVTLYRLTGGAFGGHMAGLSVLLLTSIGRKTGKQRTTPLGYFEHNGSYVIIGSNAGDARNPAWVHNLIANPRAHVQMGRTQLDVTATRVEGSARDDLWKRLVALAPGYSSYEQRTKRVIPLILLKSVMA